MDHHDADAAPDRSDAEARLRFLLEFSDVLRPLADPVAVQGEACRVLAKHLGVERAYYVRIDEDAGTASVERDFVRGASPSLVGEHRIADFAWSVAILRRGECHVVDDTQTSPVVPQADRAACEALEIAACMGAPLIKEGRLLGALCVTGSKSRKWFATDVALLREVGERLWATIERARAEDTSREQAKQLEQQAAQLRRLASELTLAEHKTRELLSKTLHDHLQQLLCSTGLQMEEAVLRFQDDDLLPSIQQSLREAVATTRSISVDLFPPVLHNDGLPDALGWIAGWARRKFGLAVMVDAELAADPDGLDTRILMFESARELVFNAVKHAGVAKVKVDLRLEPGDRVQLTVSDEGRGFAVQDRDGSPKGNLGLGLFSIQQRINLMGGKMIVDSKPGAGARIRLTVPRRAAKSDPAQSGA